MTTRILFKIGDNDYTSYIKNHKVEHQTVVKDEGTNARGDRTLTVLNKKANITVAFIPMNDTEMAALLTDLYSFVVTLTYWDARLTSTSTGTFVCSNPLSDIYTMSNDEGLYNDIILTFKEL